MNTQEILHYMGIGFIVLSALLLVLSVVVFITRDVRGALRFLRGGPSKTAEPTGERRSMAMHRGRTMSRATRDSLAEAEANAGVRQQGTVANHLVEQGQKDPTQDVIATVVNDASQDALATVVSDSQEDDIPTVVGLQDGDMTVVDVSSDDQSQPGEPSGTLLAQQEARNQEFRVLRSVVIVNAEVELDALLGEQE